MLESSAQLTIEARLVGVSDFQILAGHRWLSSESRCTEIGGPAGCCGRTDFPSRHSLDY